MMRSRWTGACGVAFGLAGFVAVGVAAGPPAHPPNATTDVAATQVVRSSGSGPCPPIAPPASAASNTAGTANAPNAPPAPYGDAHYAAARIAADVERMRQRLSCAPPVGDAYGARDAWDRIDEAAGDASNADATSTTSNPPPPAKPGSRERRRARKPQNAPAVRSGD